MVIQLMATASAWDPNGRMLKITLVMSARLSRIPKKMFIAGRKITVEGPGAPNTALQELFAPSFPGLSKTVWTCPGSHIPSLEIGT